MRNVLYVPLDDRPVNLDDTIKLGQASGLHLITPDAADIRNRLDAVAEASGETLLGTSSPTFGNSAKIRQFILDNAAAVEGFIISIDMLAYGGLIGSRRLRTSGGGTYPNYDPTVTDLLDVIRHIKRSYPSKPVYVLDTIMRLATTTFTEGLTSDAYNESRSFMRQPRQTYTAFEDILNGYNTSADNTQYGDTVYFDKMLYYNTRQHKFKTNYYVLDQLTRLGCIDFLAVGVDDASTEGAQINEIRFVESFINDSLGGSGGQNPDRAIILPDADGLGHSLVARMANQLHRGGRKTRISVNYYGPDGSTIINPYEYMNVHQNILRHIDIAGGEYATCAPDIEIVAITSADQVSGAVNRIEANGTNRQATVAMDFTGGGAANITVTEALLDSRYTGGLLGYSAWNTAGNLMGISLSMGQARYAFLVTEKRAQELDKAVNAHGSLLFKRFLKDYYYKRVAIADVRSYSRNPEHIRYVNLPPNSADQNMLLFNKEEDYIELQALLRDLMQSHLATLAARRAFQIGSCAAACLVKQICGCSWTFAEYSRVSLAYDNPDYIWGRAFEVTLSPAVTLHSKPKFIALSR
ncbi:DUF4127 family protein [Paenibacillus oralis]|uniref:DUF4127 family protein n=1 Tax=Paenibacillus oralis TaxID=2490856 RepID=A0A3P3U1J6_9BACL|nr:DUF4127 family protein [Paenibacillus oralis]RRJ64202.1 DUF4127 family protein [Paenibacillus oralis]